MTDTVPTGETRTYAAGELELGQRVIQRQEVLWELRCQCAAGPQRV